MSTAIVLVDVDGTLLRGTSLFRFLAHRLAADGHRPRCYTKHRERLAAMTSAGAPREVTNREHFRAYAGLDPTSVALAAHRWYAAELRQGGVFHDEVLQSLTRHRQDGHRIVLVSGSFDACLTPVARHVGAELTICTRLLVRAGRYTGDVAVPVVGERKVEAVRAALPDLDPALTWAYGDHVSDVPLLRLAGHPVVVGDNAELVRTGRRYGWRHVPGSGGPLPVPDADPGPGVRSHPCCA